MAISSHHQFGMSQCKLFIGGARRGVVGVCAASDFAKEEWTEVAGVIGLRRGDGPRSMNIDWKAQEADAGQMAVVQASRHHEARAFRIAFRTSNSEYVDRLFVASVLPADEEQSTENNVKERTIVLDVTGSIVRPASGTGN